MIPLTQERRGELVARLVAVRWGQTHPQHVAWRPCWHLLEAAVDEGYRAGVAAEMTRRLTERAS